MDMIVLVSCAQVQCKRYSNKVVWTSAQGKLTHCIDFKHYE